jgi:hypothetical protein
MGLSFNFDVIFEALCDKFNFRYCRLRDIIENHGCAGLQLGPANAIIYDAPYLVLALLVTVFFVGLYGSLTPYVIEYKKQSETRAALHWRAHLIFCGLSTLFGALSVSVTAYDGRPQRLMMVLRGLLLNFAQAMLIWITFVDIHILPAHSPFRWKCTRSDNEGNWQIERASSFHGAAPVKKRKRRAKGKDDDGPKLQFCLPGPPSFDLLDIAAFGLPAIVAVVWITEYNAPTSKAIITYALVIPLGATFFHLMAMFPVLIVRKLWLGLGYLVLMDGFMLASQFIEIAGNGFLCDMTQGMLSGSALAVLFFAFYRVFVQLYFGELKLSDKGEKLDVIGVIRRAKRLGDESSSKETKPLPLQFADYSYDYTYTGSEDEV